MTWSGYIPGLGLFLEFSGAAVSEGTVQSGVVVPADVVDDRLACRGAGGPRLRVDQFAFQRGEERLGEGVVPASRKPIAVMVTEIGSSASRPGTTRACHWT